MTLLRLGWIVLSLLYAGGSLAQNYPSRPVRIITADPGGGPDLAARLIASNLTIALGQQVVVDNRITGPIMGDLLAKATPDGYTLLLTSGMLWVMPLMQSVPFDPIKDFAPVTLTHMAPNLLTVHPTLPVKSVQELIAFAKAQPGQLNYASAASGTSSHLAGELFKSMAGVNIVRIPYKGSGLAINDMIGGQVQVAFFTVTSVGPHVKSGRLRALAITSAEPSVLAPGLPTVAASGLPGYVSGSLYAVFAPTGTPPAIISRLNQEIVRIVNKAEVRDRFMATGAEPVGGTPAQLAAAMKSDMQKLSKVIKDAGIKPD